QQESHSIYNEKLIISFIKSCRLFFKLCASMQTATLFAPDKLLYRKILWALPKPAIFEKIE
ncbi:hypothetical protein, partial [uncultured Ruminococcus sp.]|uniref:hypothetical protein n=1 Tax=uncultured Ruminococcus sp. TaxID=165186 RepID=UPI002673BC6B